MLNFAVDELEWIEINPAARLAAPHKEMPRTRVLSYAELGRFLLALKREHFMIRALYVAQGSARATRERDPL